MRAPEADSGNRPHFIFFDEHPAAASIAFLTAREVGINLRDIDVEAGRHAFDHGHQFGAVRLAGGKKTQHRWDSCFAVRKRARRQFDSIRVRPRRKERRNLYRFPRSGGPAENSRERKRIGYFNPEWGTATKVFDKKLSECFISATERRVKPY